MSSDTPENPGLVDGFGRRVNYLRLSVTDRCNLRCEYCMTHETRFLPHDEVLSLEEIERLAALFVELGIERLRITGGEPLVRRGVDQLLVRLGRLPGLKELTLTTNGTLVAQHLDALREAGIRRINLSLDTLDPDCFIAISKHSSLDQVLEGIDALVEAGFARLRLNTVVQQGRNDRELADLVRFAIERRADIAFIEQMPMGPMAGETVLTNDRVRSELAAEFGLVASTHKTSGPAVYHAVPGTATRIGFISPLSQCFCGSCNRIRLSVEGKLYPCLDDNLSVDLKTPLRRSDGNDALRERIFDILERKQATHDFNSPQHEAPIRFMNHTGG